VSSAAGPHFESGARTIAARRSLATARATRTATTAASIPATSTVAVASAAIAVPAARLGPGQQIDDVIEVALLLRVRRRILAAHDANQSHVVGAPAHHLERLHQAREPIAIDAHLFFDLGRRAHRALVDGWRRARFGGRALRRRDLSGRLRRRGLSRLLRRCGFALGRRALRFGSSFGRGFGGRLRGLRGRFSRCFSGRRFSRSIRLHFGDGRRLVARRERGDLGQQSG